MARTTPITALVNRLLRGRLLAMLAIAAIANTCRGSGATSWPQCDECEAVATQIGHAFEQQRKPKRLGGGLRQLRESDLEELFGEKICQEQPHRHYTMARDGSGRIRLSGDGITPPKAGIVAVGLETGRSKLHTVLASLAQDVGKRLAKRCEAVADESESCGAQSNS
eukprot:COSAG01_NODE_6820_length_3483_cov_21.635638_5_plen_167_part_00